jgi:hypothetical protein
MRSLSGSTDYQPALYFDVKNLIVTPRRCELKYFKHEMGHVVAPASPLTLKISMPSSFQKKTVAGHQLINRRKTDKNHTRGFRGVEGPVHFLAKPYHFFSNQTKGGNMHSIATGT